MKNFIPSVKLFYPSIILISLSLTIYSCSSDDDNSNEISAQDIVGAWSPIGFCNLDYIFYSDGTFEYDSYSWDYSGHYNIVNGKTLEIIGESFDSESQRVTIVKITSDEMIWRDINNGEETHFIRAENCSN